jgi:hypothetical protein
VLRDEHRLRAFGSRVLREVLELRWARKQDDGGKNCIITSLMILTLHTIWFG